MKNLAATGYAPADVITALQHSGRQLTFGYEWLGSDNSTKGWLANVQPGGSISNSALASIKRTLSVTVLQNIDPGFDFSADRIRPWVGVTMPDGGLANFPQGVFLISAPTQTYVRGLITQACSGYDQAQVLTDDIVTGRYLLKAGTLYTDAITSLTNRLPSMNIIPSGLALPVARLWDPATTKLKIVNDLLAAISYGSLWFDGFGTGQAVPYIAPADDAPGYAYTDTGETSMFYPQVDATLDLFSVPNYIVYSVSQPGRPVLTATFSNTDPNSPVSILNRGRKIVLSDATIDVATQAELNALVKRAAVNAANVYLQVPFTSPIMPIHENRDILTVTHSGLGLSGNFTETDWKMDLIAGGQMTHTVRQVVNLDASLVGSPAPDAVQ